MPLVEADHPTGVIGFRCPAHLHALAEAAAKAEGISKAAFARRALKRELEGIFAQPAPRAQEDAA